MNRRSFLSGILAAGVAPAIVRADSLMRIVPRDTTLLLPRAIFEGYDLGTGDFTVEGWVRLVGCQMLVDELRLSRVAREPPPLSDTYAAITRRNGVVEERGPVGYLLAALQTVPPPTATN